MKKRIILALALLSVSSIAVSMVDRETARKYAMEDLPWPTSQQVEQAQQYLDTHPNASMNMVGRQLGQGRIPINGRWFPVRVIGSGNTAKDLELVQ